MYLVCLPILCKGKYTFPHNKHAFSVMFGYLLEGFEPNCLNIRRKWQYILLRKTIILGSRYRQFTHLT